MAICKKEIPPLVEVKLGRKAACFLYSEVIEAAESK